MARKWLRRLGLTIGAVGILWIVIAGVLVGLPGPKFDADPIPGGAGVDAGARDQSDIQELSHVTGDGNTLRARVFEGSRPVTVLLVPGVLSRASDYDEWCRRVRDSSRATVVALDLRGHGRSEGRPGDIDYIRQWGDDISEMIGRLSVDRSADRLILAGYSMGGGIVLRYAEERRTPRVDGYLLLAPLMGPDSPTSSPARDSTNADPSAEAYMSVHVPRLIGLIMFNTIGVTAFNGLRTLYFNVEPDAPLQGYTFRAMVAMTPSSHTAALQADSLPLLTLVGSNDEAFNVEPFPRVVGQHVNAVVHVLAGLDHSTLLTNGETTALIAEWLVVDGP